MQNDFPWKIGGGKCYKEKIQLVDESTDITVTEIFAVIEQCFDQTKHHVFDALLNNIAYENKIVQGFYQRVKSLLHFHSFLSSMFLHLFFICMFLNAAYVNYYNVFSISLLDSWLNWWLEFNHFWKEEVSFLKNVFNLATQIASLCGKSIFEGSRHHRLVYDMICMQEPDLCDWLSRKVHLILCCFLPNVFLSYMGFFDELVCGFPKRVVWKTPCRLTKNWITWNI